MLRATTACTFLTSQLLKLVREWCALCILTWKCASRHIGVQFFISHLASWLRTRRFSKPTYFSTPQSHQSVEKHSESRLSYLFAHLHLLSSLIFSLLFFSSLTLPTSAVPSVHIVGSFTSKLPSIMSWSDLSGMSWAAAWVGWHGFCGFGARGGGGLSPCSSASKMRRGEKSKTYSLACNCAA